ncbi:MAG: IclR family transcriptional regulator, regulon repressor [Bradyrhizobium sp.]|nr:IclR family transcriptional regulator, regulon repressor [Bradyrhizobium sp.]
MVRPVSRKLEGSAVKTVAKVLDILEHLGAIGRPATVSEVAMTTGINVSTAHRLLQTLARRHYIEQNQETRAYTLGPRLFELGSAYARNMDLVGISRPFIEQLRDATGETVHLAILSDREVVEVCTATGSQTVTVSRGTGRRDPASCTATGKVMLAFLTPAELDRFFAGGPLPAATPKSITDPALVTAELKRVRANGFALDQQELSDDVCCVGAPIRNGPDRVIAAVSVAMPTARFRQDKVPEWTRLLVETAERISSVIRLSSAG